MDINIDWIVCLSCSLNYTCAFKFRIDVQLSGLLMRAEAELKTVKLSQARSESTNSAKLAAQSVG